MPKTTDVDPEEEEQEVDSNTIQGYDLGDSTIDDYIYGTADTSIDELVTTDLNGIFGVPYQFMDIVDRRMSSNSELGRKYADKIVSRMPLLFLTPGTQGFMEDFNASDTAQVTDALITGAAGVETSGSVTDRIEGTGRYYSFEFDYSDYFKYVNTMAWCVAYFMGIQNTEVSIGGKKKKLSSVRWQDAQSEAFKSYFSSHNNIVFYLNGLTEVTESFSNSTTESSLASTINGMSDQVRELRFLLGEGSLGDTLADISTNAIDTISSALSSLGGAVGGSVIGSLMDSGVDSVLSGGKIIFPEIWQDSSYSNSYSIDIKLRSPDNDPVSLYLNILIPYIHLLAFVLPRNVDNNDVNAYTSPFLCRAFCKGMFNVDMGLVTSMSVTKGGEQNWNNNGIPSQIDINLEIDDLYSGLFMSSVGGDSTTGDTLSLHVNDVVNNTAYMDFLSNMAGLNLAQPELLRKAKLRIYLAGEQMSSLPSRLWTSFENKVTNKISKLWSIL